MISELQQPIDSGFGAKSEPSEVLEGIDLNRKTALVTGGYSGIGLETTRALSDCGARVIVPARRRDVAIKELNGIIEEDDILNLDFQKINSRDFFVDEFKGNLVFYQNELVDVEDILLSFGTSEANIIGTIESQNNYLDSFNYIILWLWLFIIFKLYLYGKYT